MELHPKQRIILSMKKIHRNNWSWYLPEVFVGIISFSLLFLTGENTLKVITLELFILLWFILSHVFKSRIHSSIIVLLLSLPFNLTLTLPFLGDPFVKGVYVNYLSPTLSIIDLFSTVLLVTFFSELVQTRRVREYIKTIPKWIYIVIGLLILHSLFHFTPITIFMVVRLILYLITGYVVITYIRSNMRDLSNLLPPSILLLVTTQVLIAILQVQSGAALGIEFLGEPKVVVGTLGSSFLNLDSGVILRGYGTFPHPNVLAGFLLLSILFALYYMKKGWVRNLILIMSTVGIAISFSRVAWLILLIFVVIYGGNMLYRYIKGKRGMLSIVPLPFLERIGALFVGGDSSVRDRVELVNHSLEVVKGSWLFGVGGGGYVATMKELSVYTVNGLLLLQPVHNVFLLLFAEYGIIGILFICGMLFKMGVLNLRNVNLPLYLSLLVFIALVALTDHYLVTLPQGIAMLVIILLL